jgi:arylformamidase
VRDGWAAASARAKAGLEWHEDMRYGGAARQCLDLFPARAAAAAGPLLIFIHGGYWRSNDKANYAFIAEIIDDFTPIQCQNFFTAAGYEPD